MTDEELAAYEGPWLVASGTTGNRRLGALLKDLRERTGLSPQELADRADVHVSFVRGIERGSQAPSVTTAKPLFASLKEQDQKIEWMDSGPYDLLVRDPTIGRDVAFEFKARVKGQNRRPGEVPDAAEEAMLERLLGKMQRIYGWQGPETLIPEYLVLNETSADADWDADDEQPGIAAGMTVLAAPADPARFGKIVRRLAVADETTLSRVEIVLRDGIRQGQSGS